MDNLFFYFDFWVVWNPAAPKISVTTAVTTDASQPGYIGSLPALAGAASECSERALRV